MMSKYFIKKDQSIIGPESVDLNEVWHQDQTLFKFKNIRFKEKNENKFKLWT